MASEIIEEESDFEKFLKGNIKKTPAEQYVEDTWPNLPSWIISEYTVEGWLWLSAEEKESLLETGSLRSGTYWDSARGE